MCVCVYVLPVGFTAMTGACRIRATARDAPPLDQTTQCPSPHQSVVRYVCWFFSEIRQLRYFPTATSSGERREAGWIVGSVGVVGKATDTVWGFRLDRVANDLIATTFCSSVMTWSVFGHGR